MAAPRDNDRDRDDRPSWSEIDKMRDKSPHRKEKSDEVLEAKERAAVKSMALKEAKSLFNGALSPNAKKAIDAIHKAKGKPAFAGLVDDFISAYGLPEDWGLLLVMLDHPDEEVFARIAGAMQEMYGDQSLSSRQGFKSKLSILSLTSSNSEIVALAGRIKGDL